MGKIEDKKAIEVCRKMIMGYLGGLDQTRDTLMVGFYPEILLKYIRFTKELMEQAERALEKEIGEDEEKRD